MASNLSATQFDPNTADDTKRALPHVTEIDSNEEEGHAEKDKHLALWPSVKKYKRIMVYSVLLTTGILMYGFDYAIVSTTSAMPSFQHDFGTLYRDQWILPALWLGLWAFISPVCSMPGAILAGFVQDRFGRRGCLALGSFICALGVAISFVSYMPDEADSRRALFFVGKGVQGFAIGMVVAATQAYMSEVLPPSLRGPVLAFFPIFTLVGQLIGAAVIYGCMDLDKGYRVCFATQWPFCLLPFVVSFIIPESPTYLLRKGRKPDAIKSQTRLYGGTLDPERTVDALERQLQHEKQLNTATYADSFRGTNLRRTMIVIFGALIPQLFGLTMLAKASYFIQIVGMKANLSVVILMVGVVIGLISNISSIWVLSRVGRRKLIITTLIIAGLFWASMGIAGCFKGEGVVIYSATALILVVLTAGLGCWPASYALSAETSSLQLRAKAQGLGWFANGAATAVFNFVLPYVFNPDQGDLGAKTGFVFAGLSFLAAVISYFYVPEMKGRSPAEIDQMFEANIPTREFSKWSGDSWRKSDAKALISGQV